MVLDPHQACLCMSAHFQRSGLKPLGQSKPNFILSIYRKWEPMCMYISSPGHMTKMAAVPIYGKNPSKVFSGTCGPISTKLCMKHL